MPFCNQCGREILLNARYCTQCGADRRKLLPTMMSEVDKEPEAGPYCPACGKRSPEDSPAPAAGRLGATVTRFDATRLAY